MLDFKVPFISKETLARQAEAFLAKYHASRELPIPMERIVESDLGLDIVPVPGLRHFDVVAYVTSDRKEIRVDQNVFECQESRYRFSLAHEVGHLELHPGLFTNLCFSNIEEWKAVVTDSIPEKEYSFLEWQASCFAGLVLVPPSELTREIESLQGKLPQNVSNLKKLDGGARTYVEGLLGRKFVVSAEVIHRRLEFDEHL